MTVVKERIILRKGRRNGEKMPHRIRFDGLEHDDDLLVEIVTRKEDALSCCYLFQSEHRENRKSAAFRVSGDRVYWLGGVSPRPLLKMEADKLCPPSEKVKSNASSKHTTARQAKGRKILVFDEKGNLVSICVSLQNAATMMNLREAAIDKLCKTKRPSFETGYYFRYWWKVLDFDITDFSMTAWQYDLLCSRNRRLRALSGLL